MRNIPKLILGMWLLSCAGCRHVEESARAPETFHSEPADCSIGSIRFVAGGAYAKSNIRYRQENLPFKVCLVSGSESLSREEHSSNRKHMYIIGVESSEGQKIIETIVSAQPWTWEGLRETGISTFADELWFYGHIQDYKWSITLFLREERVEILLNKLREILRHL